MRHDAAEVDDKALVARCAGGERSAVDLLVSRFARLVYAVINRAARKADRPPDDDWVTEVFAATFVALVDDRARRLRAWDGRCSLASWVRLVASSVTADRMRADRRQWRGREVDVAPERLACDDADALDRALLAERIARVDAALATLSEADQALLAALFKDELGPGEVAGRLGIPAGAVYTRKNRALERLRRAFYGGGDGEV